METSDSPQVFEYIPQNTPIQDGGDPESEGYSVTRRFHGETRSSGCLLDCSDEQTDSPAPALCLGRQNFLILSLPFRLGPALLVFTKLLKPVAAFLRGQGIRLLIYLDDMLLMAQSERQLRSHVEITSGLLLHLGFILNSRKCLSDPKQTTEFLGFIVNSEQMTLSLSSQRSARSGRSALMYGTNRLFQQGN